MLSKLAVPDDAALIVGHEARDDAAVYRLDDQTALVFTADFFTPIVDDPYDFGRIAAANALSDVYAMGGRPILALNIVGFPAKQLPLSALSDILAGGASITKQAGVVLGGGHTVDDKEPKYGLAVIGLVAPDRVTTNRGAQVGDKLVVTKPLGTGVIATAIKRGLASAALVQEAVDVMVALNDGAARAVAAIHSDVHAVTDVTGFGLLGHLLEMLESSQVGATIEAAKVPVLASARRFAGDGVVPGGSRANLEHVRARATFDGVSEQTQLLLADAQTSGGLLIAVAPEKTDQLIDLLRAEETLAASIIGEIDAGNVHVRIT